MIPFLSRYMQQLHHERVYWLTKAEKRRAIRLICLLLLCIAIIILTWLQK
jgi:hypothetical protein